jgi:hypothetical protein
MNTPALFDFMRPDEQILVMTLFAYSNRERKELGFALLEPEIEGIVSGARTRAFTGLAFDAYCRFVLQSQGCTAQARDEVRRVCERSEATFGPAPWSDLYYACLLHLQEDDEAAAEWYARAALDVDVLWFESIGCRSVVAPSDRDRLLALERPIAAMRDEVTIASGRDVVFVSCDHAYLHAFGRAYLESVARYGAEVLLHVHVIDPHPGDVAWIEETSPTLNGRLAITTESHGGHDARAYYTLARLIRIAELLDRYGHAIYCTDIDAVYRTTIDLSLANESGDVGVHFRRKWFHWHPWNEIQADNLLIRPTQDGRRFARTLRSLAVGVFAERAGPGIWNVDQNVLYSAYRKFSDNPDWKFFDVDAQRPGGLAFGKHF